MDEDELAEIRGAVAVQPTADFDTFGSAAAEAEKARARADAAGSSSQAPSLASGPIIEELLAPVADSLGGPSPLPYPPSSALFLTCHLRSP